MSRMFVEMARDPRLIPGVHYYCDEWCEMCPVTSRCLAFRCIAQYRKDHGRREGEPTFRSAADEIAFTRSLAAAGSYVMPEIDAMVASGALNAGFKTKDPLADTAWQYAVGISMWLILTPDDLRRMRTGPAPSAEEVLLWYHLRIYIKLVRALVVKERLSGSAESHGEINGSAKVALVAVQRSRKALFQLKKSTASETAATLVLLLDAIEKGIHDRFPNARAFVRLGLDMPAA